MIELINISKENRGTSLLKNINIKVEKGQVYGLIGSDHSRKSLLLKLMVGVVLTSQGTLKYFGEPFKEEHLEKIGVVSEAIDFYDQLTGLENIEQYIRHYPTAKRIDMIEYFRKFELLTSKNMPVKDYSSGMLQKLRLIRALAIKPEILILDEPMKALDPVAVRALRSELIKQSKAGVTIFIATSMLSFISDIADKVGVLHYDELIDEVNLDDKKENRTYVDITSSELPKMMMILERQLNIYDYEVITERILRVFGEQNNAQIIKVLIESNVAIEGIRNGWRSLESFFLNTIGD